MQVLKRPRDVFFEGDDDAPISIIITTLAARAYQGHGSVYATLSNLLERMPTYIEYDSNGLPFVRNPMNPLENFADKWHQVPEKQKAFDNWIARAKQDLQSLAFATLSRADEPLGDLFGERIARRALKKYGERMQSRRDTGLRVATATGALGATGARATEVPKNTFYGTQSQREEKR